MNAPHDPSDPLFQSLAEETADLPARAATAARQRNAQRRQNRQRLIQTAFVALVAAITWTSLPSRDSHFPPEHTAPIATAPKPAVVANADAPRLLPTGLSEDQRRFIESVPDIPMLLVRDASGKVTRIHIVQR